MRFIIEARSKSDKKKASKYTRRLEYLTAQGVSIENIPQEIEHQHGIDELYGYLCKVEPRRKKKSHIFDDDYIFRIGPKPAQNKATSKGSDRKPGQN